MKLTAARLALTLLAAVAASAGHAQDDKRIVTAVYQPGKTIPLKIATDNSLTILLARDESVTAIEAADTDAISIAASNKGDSVSIKMLRAPEEPELTIRTQKREYRFVIEPGASTEAIYVMRFVYSGIPANATGSYKISGTKELRPSRISDDGVHTYLEWSEEQSLPAVFAVNSIGEEEMVDGYMRDGVFTIDRVNKELVFRIGKKSAKAVRNAK